MFLYILYSINDKYFFKQAKLLRWTKNKKMNMNFNLNKNNVLLLLLLLFITNLPLRIYYIDFYRDWYNVSISLPSQSFVSINNLMRWD